MIPENFVKMREEHLMEFEIKVMQGGLRLTRISQHRDQFSRCVGGSEIGEFHMHYFDKMSLNEMIDECSRLISLLGIDLQVGRDFEIFKYYVSDSSKEAPLDPIFDPGASDVADCDGLWLLGRNRSGQIIQTQAVRGLNLGNKNFAQYLEGHIADIRPEGMDVDIKNTRWRLSRRAAEISGSVFYHGGLWIHKDCRGGSLATLVTRYLLARTISELEPDYFVGLQAPYTSCKGLAAREGYMHMEQRSILWRVKDRKEAFEDWLVWMDREEAEFNLTIPPSDLFDMFEKTPASVAAKTGTNG